MTSHPLPKHFVNKTENYLVSSQLQRCLIKVASLQGNKAPISKITMLQGFKATRIQNSNICWFEKLQKMQKFTD